MDLVDKGFLVPDNHLSVTAKYLCFVGKGGLYQFI